MAFSVSSGLSRKACRQVLPDFLGFLHCDSYSRFSLKIKNKMILEKKEDVVWMLWVLNMALGLNLAPIFILILPKPTSPYRTREHGSRLF